MPLTTNPNLSRILGTRHRAAIGLSEQTDALVVIVSEETGKISVAEDGKIEIGLSLESLGEDLINPGNKSIKESDSMKIFLSIYKCFIQDRNVIIIELIFNISN